MNCDKVRRYLDAAVDQELEPGIMLEVENHLMDCPACRAVETVKKDLKKELSKLGEVKAPPHLMGKIETASVKRRRNRRIAAFAGPLAAAAALLIVLKISVDAPVEEPVTALVEDVVERHVRELPMEVKGPDTNQAVSWFRGKVDFPVRAPGVGFKNASFQGARLSHVRSHQAAHMTYLVDGHRVTLMIFNPRSVMFTGGKKVMAGNREVLLGRRNGFNVAIFMEGDMAYALSSDLSQKRLLKLVERL